MTKIANCKFVSPIRRLQLICDPIRDTIRNDARFQELLAEKKRNVDPCFKVRPSGKDLTALLPSA